MFFEEDWIALKEGGGRSHLQKNRGQVTAEIRGLLDKRACLLPSKKTVLEQSVSNF